MKWTTELPKVSGWYWHKPAGLPDMSPRIAKVVVDGNKVMMMATEAWVDISNPNIKLLTAGAIPEPIVREEEMSSSILESNYNIGLDYLKRWGTGSPRHLQEAYYYNKSVPSKSRAVYLTCQFILEGVRREEIEITDSGSVTLIKPKETK